MNDHTEAHSSVTVFLGLFLGAAVIALVVFWFATPGSLTTFLGSAGVLGKPAESRLLLVVEKEKVQKGKTFSGKVVLETGSLTPESVFTTVSFDPNVLSVVDVNEGEWSFAKDDSFSIDNSNGRVLLTRKLEEDARDVIEVAEIEFRAGENLGATTINLLEPSESSLVLSSQSSENVLGEVIGDTILITLEKPVE